LAAEPEIQARPRKWLYPVVLVVLQDESSYGYEIMKRLTREFGFEQINPGTIYLTLRQRRKKVSAKPSGRPPETAGQAAS